MYDDNVTVRVGVNWKEIVIKVVLLIIFILILCWLFPKPNLDIFYDSVYTNNINTMKEAAKTYYTTDKLPQTVGESKSMTLKEMIDNHMIIRFADKNGKTCDESTSKVEVTKISDKEYALKVILNCGDDKDYIIETIGCNSVCTGEGCTIINNNYVSNNSNGSNNGNNGTNNGSNNNGSTNDEGTYNEDGTPVNGGKAGYDDSYTIDTVYYQFRKAITNTSTVYSCPAGYTRNGSKCYKYTQGAAIDATVNYYPDQTVVEDAKYTAGGTTTVYADPIKTPNTPVSTCPSGYTLNGSYCVKYTDATEKTEVTYTCPAGYNKNSDNKCYRTYDATYVPGSDGYTCPQGGTRSGTKCTITIDATSSTTYTCPSGYTKNGSSCYKVYDATYTPGTTTYSCPSGYTRNDKKCYKTIDATYTPGATTYSCPSGYTRNNTKCYKTIDATYTPGATTYSCPQGGTRSGTTCTKTQAATQGTEYGSWTTSSTFYSQSAGLATSCSGSATSCVQYLGSITGAACGSPCGNKGIWYKYARKSRTTSTTYTCPSGWSRSGSTCSYSYTATASQGEGSYSCPSGYTRSGTKCTHTIDATASQGEGSYSCPSGYTRSGTKCTHTVDATATTGEGSYSCPQGGTRSGTKCTITVNATAETTYTCPSGYTRSGTKCNKTYDATVVPGEGTYTCPEGGTRSGTKCNIVKDADKHEETKYTCPSGYTLNNSTKKCESKVDPTQTVTYTYTCPEGYTKSGEGENTKCSKTVTGEGRYYCEYTDAVLSADHKCTRVIKGQFSHYSCPSSEYTLVNGQCKIGSQEVINATATTQTSTSYKYTWSKSSTLKGWEFTGKTKVVSEKYQGGQQ